MSKNFKQDPMNYHAKIKSWEGKNALFTFVGGSKEVHKIVKVEAYKPSFIVENKDGNEELLLGGILRIKPIGENEELIFESHVKTYPLLVKQ